VNPGKFTIQADSGSTEEQFLALAVFGVLVLILSRGFAMVQQVLLLPWLHGIFVLPRTWGSRNYD
jgi:hypothetical protein